MKKANIILLLSFIVSTCSFGQITLVTGGIRYEHEYQDLLYNDALSVINRSSPALDLRIGGILLSPRIMDFDVSTALNLNYGTSSANGYLQTNQQSYWNAYDATVNFFSYSPIKLQLAARDHLIENKSDFGGVSSVFGQTRSQEQRARLAIEKTDFLPSMTFYYVQNRAWALTGFAEEQTSRQLSFSLASASGQASSVNLSGSFTNTQERYTGIEDRIASLQFTGAKELSVGNRLDVAAEYYRYSAYSTLNGSVRYTGLLNEKLRISSAISGTQTNSAYSTYHSVDASEAVNMLLGEHYNVGWSLYGSSGKYNSLISNTSSDNPAFGSTASAQHNRILGKFTLTNALSVGYLVKNYGEIFRTWEGALANTVSTNVGEFALSGNYDFSLRRTKDGESWTDMSNSGGLSASGNLGSVRSRSSAHFRTDNYSGDFPQGRNQHNLNVTQGFEQQLGYKIPMTLGLGGSINWYFSSLINKTYGWYFSFSSPSFFLSSMFVNYRYTRNFDPYYQKEIVNHNGSVNYQWRALTFMFRFRYATFPNRLRDLTFSVSRPF